MSNQKAKYPKLINLDSVQNRELNRISKETKLPVTELIREAIKEYIELQKESN